MKKLILSKFILTFFVIILFSCEKNQEHCWKCSWDAGYTKPMSECNKTEDEIRQYERDMSFKLSNGSWVFMNCYQY